MRDDGRVFRGYHPVITGFPQADIQFEDIKAWILQAQEHQLVFFEMESTAQVPEHSHNYPQWGIVIEGEMRLTIDGETITCRQGDEYIIPANSKHYAVFSQKTRVVDLFSERTRYETKPRVY